ncbi:MAG: S49 family peptidase, partial [Pseudomonadota bacterium]
MRRHIPFLKSKPTVAVVRLSGVIMSGRGLNDRTSGALLEKAFRSKPEAVALVINSPGGSPVQSSLIGARIRRLSEEKKVPVTAFVEDVAASGGYWLAAAADEILVDESSVIGSIGVISSGFGLHEFIAKNGIERRVYTAGVSKSMNDMFMPEKPEDVDRLKGLLEDIHQTFKSHVSSRRAEKLADGEDLFTGEVWVGQKG